MKNKIIGLVIILLIAAGSFYGGIKYSQSKTVGSNLNAAAFANLSQEERQARFQQMGVGGQSGATARRAGGGMAAGEILAQDDKSITVKLQDGGSKIVFYSDSTKFQKMSDVSKSDFSVGASVTVNGTTNSDGSITAQTIQLRPAVLLQPSGTPGN